MYALTKFLTWLASPLVIALVLGLIAWGQAYRGKRGRAIAWLVVSVVWLLVWTSPIFYAWFGCTLESQFPACRAEEMPAGDAIVVLGGGMESTFPRLPYADMNGAADRLWHAARLYKAGKAPMVILSGAWDDVSSRPLLLDLGVPAAAIRVETASRNTSENARFTAALLQETRARRVLLVTSAWHMRRSQLLFAHTGVDAIPAATDYEATIARARPDRWGVPNLLPSPDALNRNTGVLKEYIGYWVCRLGW
jgi:uncharacterized SAM-binding protein YcdF (DUF218 family)